MKGIRIIMLAAAMLLAAGCGSRETLPADVVLELSLSDYTGGTPVLVSNMKVSELVPDENGQVSLTLPAVKSSYAVLYWGQSSRQLYFEGGDKLKISFSTASFERSFKVEGPSAAAVRYLNTVSLPPFNDEFFGLDTEAFIAKLDELEAQALTLLDARDFEGSPCFRHMEEGRIAYSYASMLLMYPVGHSMMTENAGYEPDERWYEEVRSHFVADGMWVNVDAYRNFMTEAAHALDMENAKVSEVYPKTLAQMRYIADHIGDGAVREQLIHYLAAAYVDFYGIDGIVDLQNIYFTYVTDPRLLEDYREKYDRWDRSVPGKVSPDFEAEDVEGRKHSLEEFRGKVVYIDLWATWCNPCRAELPYLKDLEKKFSGKDFVILGLSIDGNRAAWEKKVGEGELAGVQLYLGPQSSFQKAYRIEGIPRFILLDKEGKIVNNAMSRPSEEATAGAIGRLLEK